MLFSTNLEVDSKSYESSSSDLSTYAGHRNLRCSSLVVATKVLVGNLEEAHDHNVKYVTSLGMLPTIAIIDMMRCKMKMRVRMLTLI